MCHYAVLMLDGSGSQTVSSYRCMIESCTRFTMSLYKATSLGGNSSFFFAKT